MSGLAPVAIGVDRSSDAGHIVELTRQDEVGDRESEWMNEYGWVWRVKHCLGVLSLATIACAGLLTSIVVQRDVLFVVDPKVRNIAVYIDLFSYTCSPRPCIIS